MAGAWCPAVHSGAAVGALLIAAIAEIYVLTPTVAVAHAAGVGHAVKVWLFRCVLLGYTTQWVARKRSGMCRWPHIIQRCGPRK